MPRVNYREQIGSIVNLDTSGITDEQLASTKPVILIAASGSANQELIDSSLASVLSEAVQWYFIEGARMATAAVEAGTLPFMNELEGNLKGALEEPESESSIGHLLNAVTTMMGILKDAEDSTSNPYDTNPELARFRKLSGVTILEKYLSILDEQDPQTIVPIHYALLFYTENLNRVKELNGKYFSGPMKDLFKARIQPLLDRLKEAATTDGV